MFGLGFLNSAFLGALVATALPIIIHLLNRRRVRKVPFSTLEFLIELSKRRMRKVNLRRILILVLRTLAVLFIVLTFARPTMRSAAALFLPGTAPKSVVIGIDASYSMGVERETGTAFTRAKEIATEVIERSGKEDLINIVVFSNRVEALFEKGTRNKQLAANAVEKAELTAEGTSVDRAVEKAFELIDQTDFENGEVYIISDFRSSQDSIWVPPAPRGVRVMLLPVYGEAVDNVSIDRVLVPRKLIRPGETVRVSVAVSNHSRENSADFRLELVVDGTRKAERVIHLEPAATASVEFSSSFNKWGMYRGTVAKSRDRLPVDDERYFLLDVSKSLPVTLIRGLRQLSSGTQAAGYYYVERALNPRRTTEGEFTVRIVDENALTASDLSMGSVVVWTDPQLRIDRKRMGLIERYVRGGGALLVFLGSGAGGIWKNKEFTEFIGIGGVTHKETVRGERLTSFQKDHQIFNIFTEDELELLSLVSVRAFKSAKGVASDSVVAYFSSGDPAIWECTRGNGKLLIFAAAPDIGSGDLPLSPMFLPLIHTSVSYLASEERAGRLRENFVGSELFFDLPEPMSASGGALTVAAHSGARLKPLIYDTQQGEKMAILQRPWRPGFYRLLSDTTVVTETVVNLDTRESDLNPALFEKEVLGKASVVDTGDEFLKNLREAQEGREIYSIFLLLAAAALVSEALLGRRA